VRDDSTQTRLQSGTSLAAFPLIVWDNGKPRERLSTKVEVGERFGGDLDGFAYSRKKEI